ncbi:N-acyl homoserine lactonase family protein [Microbacterium sp. CFH 31415]|uniref:N-acyl homoserine lactonase family protein n=1 Tax=Microbacterium sp. CFH 31415 TaxID=2921732 RepID=UPI001F139BAD|nr:N-acyl homoserine lactonase family protein [Microbacterium sp. CFH 31415]MCH6231625.1 N-acyl homoserine lactonase family protein [Microbacterium sp. CFH 31415]
MSRGTAVRMWALEPATYRSPAHVAEFGSAAPRIPFPIYLVEHAEGFVLFDAGLDPDHAGDPAGAYGEMAQRIDMVFDERHLVETHLEAIGRSMDDVTTVVASHLHFDHAGSLKRFPRARTILGAGELEYARAPERFSSAWFRDEDFGAGTGLEFDVIDEDEDVFGDGSLVVRRLPGHTPGSLALQVALPERTLVLSGDVVHTRGAYESELHYHGDVDSVAARASLRRLRGILDAEKADLWIAHDPADWERFGGAGEKR